MSLKNEIAAYERMRTDLEAEYLGSWALVHNEEFTGTFESFEQAAETVSTPCPKTVRIRHYMLLDSPGPGLF
ncbi:MAG: hypothetical protein OXQ89_09705 [Rhodospirillaceae bacterium]|nr:hypothetical protein [Rhodospirillaceae bacterium]